MTLASLIQLSHVAKTYAGAATRPALSGIDLSIDAGTFIAILGKSGSGKSTLFNLIGGLDRPSEGTIRIGDDDLQKCSETELTRWRGRNIGLVFQFFQLLPTLSALENVLAAMEFVQGRIGRSDRERALDLLQQVGLTDNAGKRPAQLSGGQQQRVAIARALANDPPIILADEPTGNLDSATAGEILSLFAGLARKRRTVLIITLDTDVAAAAERRITLADGAIIADETAVQTAA